MKLLAVVLLAAASGCGHFFVEQRTLDAYASVPVPQRKALVVHATRVEDGRAALIRVSEARPEPVTRGTQRRVRVLRPMTVVGLTFVIAGAAWIGAGLAELFTRQCDISNDQCVGVKVTAGSLMAGFGGLEVLTGTILAGAGAGSTEVRRLDDRLKELR